MHHRISRLVLRVQRRLEGEQGFTLIELVIVMMIMGILLTIAVPSYLSLEDRANKTAAKQDLSQVLRAVEAYANDNYVGSPSDPDAGTSTTDNGYSNVSLIALATKYDASISTTPGAPFVVNPAGFLLGSATNFCITAQVGRWTAAQEGAGGVVTVGTNFAGASCTAS